jgi:nucleoside diphosphate kinase
MRDAPKSKISDACVVLLKWDALELGKRLNIDIVSTAKEWFESAGLYVLAVNYIDNLNEDQIDKLYDNIRQKPYFESMKASLLFTPAVAVLIGGNGDVANQIKKIKGDPDTVGTLRWHWSYKRQFERTSDYSDWVAHKGKYTDKDTWQEIQYKIYRDDRIHSSVNSEETRQNCKMLFSAETIAGITKIYPELEGVI